ncbi:hypothetical protein [Catelliglobosispora koreensis]|uniref:hypothetical protein n=1 Tax=Catelliglobosispora koreensis TaxID=129052 RepID=UPI0003721265|nr:hypothetical protein [Catelliglobosispora koreensis]
MTMTNLPLAWEPEACTLPTAERPLRLAEFDTLFTGLTTLDRLTPTHARLHLTGPAGLEEVVRDLTARETACCSFFTFTVTPVTDRQLTLDIEVPAAHTAVLEALAGRAETIAATPTGS